MKPWAMPSPMPPLPPVTKAVLLVRSKGESCREWWDMGCFSCPLRFCLGVQDIQVAYAWLDQSVVDRLGLSVH